MKYDFITIGGATRDVSFFTDQGILVKNKQDVLRQELLAFEYGAKIKVDRFHYQYGGGAANAAVCLSRLSFKTACLSSIGNDYNGQLILDNLKNNGVDISLVKKYKNEESASSFILIAPSGERIIFGSRGANLKLKIDDKDKKIFSQTKNIYLASLSGAWQSDLKNVFSVVKPSGPKVYWNPGGAQIRSGLVKLAPFLKKTEVFALNKDEAIELVLSSPKHRNLSRRSLNDTSKLLEILYSFGPKIVVVTLGAQGVFAYDGKRIYRRGIKEEKKRIDTTGIGDAFNSSFAASYSKWYDIDKALTLALQNAAHKVSYLGAQNGLMRKNIKKQ